MDDKTHSCKTCKHYRPLLDDCEAGSWVHECTARPGMDNLLSFPFKNTTCKAWEQRTDPLPKGHLLNEALRMKL